MLSLWCFNIFIIGAPAVIVAARAAPAAPVAPHVVQTSSAALAPSFEAPAPLRAAVEPAQEEQRMSRPSIDEKKAAEDKPGKLLRQQVYCSLL